MQNLKVDVSFVRHPFRMRFVLLDLAPLVRSTYRTWFFGKWLLKLAELGIFHLRLPRAHYYPNFILAMDVYLAPIFFVGKRLFPEAAKSVV